MSQNTAERPESALHKRWMGLRNYQSDDFWAMVFARPMTIALLLPVAELRWLTPNILTVLSVVTKLLGAALIAFCPCWSGAVGGAVLVNLGLVLDNMDGTLARYRGSSSFSGYYLDKISDLACLFVINAAMAYRAWDAGGGLAEYLIPLTGFAGGATAGYAKWIASRVQGDMDLLLATRNGTLQAWAEKKLRTNPSSVPPVRSAKDWLLFYLRAVLSILKLNEVDIYFFIALALLLNQLWIYNVLMCGIYSLAVVFVPAHFYIRLRRYAARNGLA